MRGAFWLLIAAATVQLATAAACLAAAAFSKPIPRRSFTYAPATTNEVFGRAVSLSWATDRGLLVTAIVLAVTGLTSFVVAAHRR